MSERHRQADTDTDRNRHRHRQTETQKQRELGERELFSSFLVAVVCFQELL